MKSGKIPYIIYADIASSLIRIIDRWCDDYFYNTDQYWYHGTACSSRTNVYHGSYTSREPFSPIFRVCHINVGWRYFNLFVSVNNLFGSKNVKWQKTGTITD